jgi:hypothetical protein
MQPGGHALYKDLHRIVQTAALASIQPTSSYVDSSQHMFQVRKYSYCILQHLSVWIVRDLNTMSVVASFLMVVQHLRHKHCGFVRRVITVSCMPYPHAAQQPYILMRCHVPIDVCSVGVRPEPAYMWRA